MFQYEQPSVDDIIRFRGHQLSVTCVVISTDNQFIYSGSKDCSIIKCKSKYALNYILPKKHTVQLQITFSNSIDKVNVLKFSLSILK